MSEETVEQVKIDIEAFDYVLNQMFPNVEGNMIGTFKRVQQEDGSIVFFGPLGSFVFVFDLEANVAGYYVSVNGDPDFSIRVILDLLGKFPYLKHIGPYSEDMEQQGRMIVKNEEIASHRMHFVMQQAKAFEVYIAESQKSDAGIILPQEKEIILA